MGTRLRQSVCENLWRFVIDGDESSIKAWALPDPEDWRSSHQTGRRKDLYETRPQPGLSTDLTGWIIKKVCGHNTHKGLFQFNCLPYGVSSSSAIFQRVMESLLQDIPGIVIYIDDILVTGLSNSDYLVELEEVLSRMETAGLSLQKSKCKFMAPSVTYLGYTVNSEGLHPIP